MKQIDDNHITIQGWMRTALNLKGERLQAFALVYGFSQDGESKFYGSLKYVMDWLGCSKPTAIAVLDYLTNQGLIIKQSGKTGVESNRYTVNKHTVDLLRQERAKVVKELYHSGKESLPVGVKNFNHSGKHSLPDSYNDKDIDNNIEREAPAQFHVQLHSLETINPEIGEVSRPAARPASKVSEVQANLNAFSDAAEYFLRLIEAKKYDLGTAAKYTVPYFRHKQQTGKWIALCIPAPDQEHRWLGEHMAGIKAWAENQVRYDMRSGTSPQQQPAKPVQIRRDI